MTVFNPNWIGLDGEPVTGRVPPRVTVYSAPGVELSRGQQGAVAHAYRLFCVAVSHSAMPASYHLQTRVFSDGTRVRMTSHQGVHEVKVWIDGLLEDREAYRGFALVPKWAGAAFLSWPGVNVLVRYKPAPTAAWSAWVKSYEPGKTGATPTYYVDESKRGKSRGIKINQDVPYADVYALSGSRLFRNGVPFSKFAAADDSIPVPVPLTATPALTAWFAVSDDGVKRLSPTSPPTLDPLWSASVLMSGISGIGLEAGFHYNPADKSASFQRLLLTPPGALQRRQATVQLLGAPPWYDAPTAGFAQINARVEVRNPGGYTLSTTVDRDEPIAPLRSTNAAAIAGIYAWIETGVTPLTGVMHGENLVPSTPYNRLEYIRDIVGPDNVSVEIFPGISATLFRAANITMAHEYTFSTIWYNAWPAGPIYNAGGVPGTSAAAVNSFAASPMLGGPSTLTGDRTTIAKYERGGKMEESDTTTSLISLSVGGVIYDASTTHALTHTQLAQLESDPPPGPQSIGALGTYYSPDSGETFFPTFWPFVRYLDAGYLPDRGDERRVESVSVIASAKDYVYFDMQNNVYLWFETKLSGSWTQQSEGTIIEGGDSSSSSSSTRSLSIEIQVVLSSPHTGEVRQSVLTFEPDAAPTVYLILPENTNQDVSGRTFKYVTPSGPQPMFAPKWMHQGACPYIAYTTEAEASSAAAAGLSFVRRLLASFRLQIVFQGRPLFAELAAIPGAQIVNLPMMEQLLGNHYNPLYSLLLSVLETIPIVLNAASPAGNVHAAIGITDANPHSEIYRT